MGYSQYSHKSDPFDWLVDFLHLFIFTYLAAPGLTCDTWDLHSCLWHAGAFGYSMWTLDCSMQYPVPWPGIKPRPSALGVWSLNHWTTRKVPKRDPFWMSVRSCHVFFLRTLQWILISINTRHKFLTIQPYVIRSPISVKLYLPLFSSLFTPLPPTADLSAFSRTC